MIEDTPHGFAYKFFEKSMQEASLTYEEKQQRAKRNISTLSMDHYDYPVREPLFLYHPHESCTHLSRPCMMCMMYHKIHAYSEGGQGSSERRVSKGEALFPELDSRRIEQVNRRGVKAFLRSVSAKSA